MSAAKCARWAEPAVREINAVVKVFDYQGHVSHEVALAAYAQGALVIDQRTIPCDPFEGKVFVGWTSTEPPNMDGELTRVMVSLDSSLDWRENAKDINHTDPRAVCLHELMHALGFQHGDKDYIGVLGVTEEVSTKHLCADDVDSLLRAYKR